MVMLLLLRVELACKTNARYEHAPTGTRKESRAQLRLTIVIGREPKLVAASGEPGSFQD